MKKEATIDLPGRERAVNAFRAQHGTAPTLLVRAPGRVNLIGGHTDYNSGFVLPLAIDRAAWIALRPRNGRHLHIKALDVGEESELDLSALDPDHAVTGWAGYVAGPAWAHSEAGLETPAWEGVLASDVPVGAGLSSSAAVEVAVLRAFAAVADHPWEAGAAARLARRAENVYVGVACGIMDMLASAAGVADHALLIDCRTEAVELVPIPEEVAVVILDSGTRRTLAESAYNDRRVACEAAAQALGVEALRDTTVARLTAADLDQTTFRRARHVVTESTRTRAAADALRRGDLAEVGRLMDESHASLRDDFEVSSSALDALVAAAREHPACWGARMTGAGFGGCAVALVSSDTADTFVARTLTAYRQATGLTAVSYITQASAGASLISTRNE